MANTVDSSDKQSQLSAVLARLRADPLLVTGLGFWLVTLVAYFVPLHSAMYTTYEASVAELGLLILAVLLFLNSAIKATSSSSRMFWALIAMSFVFWLAGRVATLVAAKTDLTDSGAPGIVADVIYLGYYACIIAAVELRFEMRGDAWWLLNFGTSAAAGVLLFFAVVSYVALVPFAVGTAGYQSYFNLYAAMDFYLATRLSLAAIRSRAESWSRAYWMLALTFALVAIADGLSWLYRSGYFEFRPESTINLIWNMWCPAAFIASRVKIDVPKVTISLIGRIYPAANVIVIFGLALPVLHLAGYGFGLFDPDFQNARIVFVFLWIILVGAILIIFHSMVEENVIELTTQRGFAENKADSLERQLERTQRMGLLGRLSAGLAHDVGNTISAIGMHAKVIAKKNNIGDIDPRDIEGIVKGVGFANDLMAKLRAFGSAEGRRVAEPLDVAGEVRDTLRIMRPSLRKNVSVELHCSHDSVMAHAEKTDIHQVLSNFLFNAMDAVEEEGVVTVAVSKGPIGGACASCSSNFSDEYVALTVTDNGPGVAPGMRHKLFEPLTTTKGVGRGGGLGLATVHGIVHRLGGHVGLVTSDSGGSSFSAYFVTC